MIPIYLPLLIALGLPIREGSVPKPNDSVYQLTDAVEIADSLNAAAPMLLPFEALMNDASAKYDVPVALIAGVIQEESRFDAWAERVEVAYLRNNQIKRQARHWTSIHANGPNYQTELEDRARSMGLMQVMGEVAREQQFGDRYLSTLFAPERSIDEGTKLLRRLLDRYPNDTLAAISAYNQGSARRSHAHHRAGAFLNARYVYRVMIAWHAYERLFAVADRRTHG